MLHGLNSSVLQPSGAYPITEENLSAFHVYLPVGFIGGIHHNGA